MNLLSPKTYPTYENPVCDLNGKSILVTGGTGSFGHAFVQEVVERFEPEKLIIFSRDELKQFEMAQKFPDQKHKFLRYFIGDVRDVERLEIAMRDVDYVVHAAALKQVPVAEYNPFECIQTNVHGAENVVRAAMRSGVTHLVGSALGMASRLAGVSMMLGRITLAVTPVPFTSAAIVSVSAISPILETA